MSESKLRVSRTHSADEFEGTLFGIEVVHFKWMALALVVALAIFAGLFYGLDFGFMASMKWAGIPVLGCFVYLRFGHQGKPPGYMTDLLDSIVTRGNAKPPPKSPDNPFQNE